MIEKATENSLGPFAFAKAKDKLSSSGIYSY
jgi:hypothetical protein